MDDLKLAGLPEMDPEDVIAQEVIEHPEATNERTIARRIAVQVLYEIDSVDHPAGEVVSAHLDFNQPSRKVASYVRWLVEGVVEHHGQIDRVIKYFAPEFPLSQVALVDRNVLRIAIFEMVLDARVPVGAAITEAVELAKLYGSDGSPRFVNGVLGAVASETETVRSLIESDELLYMDEEDEDEEQDTT